MRNDVKQDQSEFTREENKTAVKIYTKPKPPLVCTVDNPPGEFTIKGSLEISIRFLKTSANLPLKKVINKL